MSKNLVIVESPNKVAKIQSYLGDKEYKVMASVGHIRDLSTSGPFRLGLDLETMTPKFSLPRDKREIAKEIKREAAKAKTILLATDPDREGEAIAWHVQQIISEEQITKEFNLNDYKKLNFKRIVFNEITEEAVKEALNHQRDLDEDLIKSQETRRILDRMIGFRLSSLTQHKIHAKSAGRVKSVVLKMLCEREEEIRKFVPEHWYTLEGLYKKDQTLINVDDKYSDVKYKDKKEVEKVFASLGNTFNQIDREEKVISVSAPKPLEMSSYLSGMYSSYGVSNAQATIVAQKLYEKGYITYPRTDSTRISSGQFIGAAKKLISTQWGEEYYYGVPKSQESAGSQDAHEAIRPTYANKTSKELKLLGNEKKAYDYIWGTTIKSFMVPGKNLSVKTIYDNNKHKFALKSSEILEPGYRIVDLETKSIKDKTPSKITLEKGSPKKDTINPDTNKPFGLAVGHFDVIDHASKPPARFNFGSIIKKMKEDGIGRPSTYNATTTGLVAFNYVKSEKGVLSPTDLGEEVNKFILHDFSDIVNEKYTAAMEYDLDQIAHGKVKPREYLKQFWATFEPKVEHVEKTAEVKLPEFVKDENGNVRACPTCGNPLQYRLGRFGKFISCSTYPACKYIESLVKKEPARKVGRACPDCGKDLVYRKTKRSTEFIGCSGFPKCQYHEYPEKPGHTQEVKLDVSKHIKDVLEKKSKKTAKKSKTTKSKSKK